MIFTFNRAARTFGVTFLQEPTPLSRHDMPLISPAAAGTTRPSLYMGFDFAGGGAAQEYVADNIVISEREPDI